RSNRPRPPGPCYSRAFASARENLLARAAMNEVFSSHAGPGRSLTRQPSRRCRSCKDLIYMFYAARRLQPTLQGIHGDPARNRLLFGISPRWRLDKHIDLLAHKSRKVFGSESVDDLEDSGVHALRIVSRQ